MTVFRNKGPADQPPIQTPAADEGKTVRVKWMAVAGLALIALAAAWFGVRAHIEANTVSFYHVYKDGEAIGTVDSKEDVEQLTARLEAEARQAHPNATMIVETGRITYEPDNAYKAEVNSAATLARLADTFAVTAAGAEVRVNGKLIGIAKDEAAAQRVLERVQEQYAGAGEGAAKTASEPEVKALAYDAATAAAAPAAPESSELVSIKIVEDVHTADIRVADPDRVSGEDELFERLIQGTTRPTQYTVQEGDCVGCIAQKFEVPMETIHANNPWIVDEIVRPGDVLDLTIEQPAVTVQTIERVTETITLEPPVEIRENPDMPTGTTEVIRPGKAGEKRVTYKQIKQNGKLLSEEPVEETLVREAVPKVVMKGTKVLGEGTGTFAWPVNNYRITSKYGPRWGRQHKGIDLVGNSSILASDNGVVEFAGRKNGYGNAVIIDHNNGYKTLYGHMSSLSVEQGEIVEKGDKLGVMGTTGNSTGIHLHFEIIKDGEVLNPLNYLK
ncbi:M23 family metallopeptidase [Paenibacillus sp. IB182496]|uniref:M23 family metallopeptidase n=1 Tax=Paenibacillus sabuli TaxID=2772509 RepID=A0A927BW81_9BACL|nr:M23 family metallopeptidase [Paenibacillus sabuli]MBD2847992.1 M23 family metallopeptidase [Paenibacillus sabuli]